MYLDEAVRDPILLRMSPFAPPHFEQHPDRFLQCQEALESSVLAVVEAMTDAGWGPEEVAAALVELADNNMLSVLANRDLKHELATIKE